MSSKILDAVIEKIQALDDVCSPTDTQLCYNIGHTDYAEVSVPPTNKARQLLRALLVEIGRHECELANNKKEAFVKTANAKPVVLKGDFGI